MNRRRWLTILALANVVNALIVVGALSIGTLLPDAEAQEITGPEGFQQSSDGSDLTQLGAEQARAVYLELISELTARKTDFDRKEEQLVERERQFEVLKQELSNERKQIEITREEIGDEKKMIEEFRSPSFDRLLKAYEGMEPANAASALTELYERDQMVVVDLLLGIKPRQAAATLDALAATSPGIAAELSLEIWKKDPDRRRR